MTLLIIDTVYHILFSDARISYIFYSTNLLDWKNSPYRKPLILKGVRQVEYKPFFETTKDVNRILQNLMLSIALAKPSSFPVGKVNFMQIDPMTFSEFLIANGDENLAAYLESTDTIEPIPDAFFNPLYEKLKMYYITGGMPESVLMWTEARDISAMQEALSGIIDAYERDFAKHPDVREFPKYL